MTTVESLLSWDIQKLEQLTGESGEVAKIVNVFREFLVTVADERQRFADERGVWVQQVKVAEVTAEQRCSELQNQLFDLSSRLRQEASKRDDAVKRQSVSDSSVAELQRKIELLTAEKTDAASQLHQMEVDMNSHKIKLEDSLRRLQYKDEELRRMAKDWEGITVKEATLSKLQAETRTKLSDLESRETSLKFREERIAQEKDLATSQTSWLTEELSSKTEELSKLRQSSTESICRLKSELAEKSEEVAFLSASQAALKETGSKLEGRVEELVGRLSDRDAAHAEELENVRVQLNKQERLAELYNTNNEEYQTKIKELTGAIGDMQTLLKQAQEENGTLEEHCNDQLTKHLASSKDLENKVVQLQNELDHANDLILNKKSDLDISQLSGTAASVSGMMKSGMTITQMYSAYVESTEQLSLEKDKNRIQAQYLDQILKEIEEKAPLLQQQRAEYETALLNQDALAEKLEKAMAQTDHYRIAMEESQSASRASKRENDRYKGQVKDLSQQIQVLLREVEDARAGRVSRPSSRTSQSPRGSSSRVISDELVDFRSLVELQQQNQRLLSVVRELSEEQERREIEDENPKVVELRAQIESLKDQVKELKAAHGRQVELVEAVAKQRDMYRVLLTQAGHKMPLTEEAVVKGKGGEGDPSSGSKHEVALSELQREFTDYKTEKRDQLALVQEQLERARSEHSTMLAEKTRLASQLEFAGEKFKMVESAKQTCSDEAKQYKTKCEELTTSVSRLTLTRERLEGELLTAREELTKLRHSLETQRKTVELLRVTEIKQRTQNESLMRESRNQTTLLANLQTIHNNVERAEFEQKGRVEARVNALEGELAEARRTLHSIELKYRTSEAVQGNKAKELEASLMREQELGAQRKRELEDLQATHKTLTMEAEELRDRVQQLKCDLSQAAQGLPSSTREISPHETNDTIVAQAGRLKEQSAKITQLQHTVLELTAKQSSLSNQVELAKQHADQYKSISEAHEEALREMSQSEQSAKCDTAEQFTRMSGEIESLTSRLSSTESQRQQLQTQLDELFAKTDKTIKELRETLAKTETQLAESRNKETTAASLEREIRAQFGSLNSLYESSQSGLTEQRQLAASLDTKCTQLSSEIEELTARVSEATQLHVTAESKHAEDTKLWEAERAKAVEEMKTLNSKNADLEAQNALLHTQLNSLSTEVQELQKAIANDQPVVPTEGGEKSNEELWEIIRYVRQEKEILSSKLTVVEAESGRYGSRAEALQTQLDEARRLLEAEQARNTDSLMTSDQHRDLLRKVEESQGLAEKLRLLSQEKEKVAAMNGLLKQQSAVYEKQLKPLKAKNRELTERVSILESEKEGLTRDVKLWSDRSNELIEQCNKVDAKEFARLQTENGKLKGAARRATEEHRAEVERVSGERAQLEAEAGRASEERAKLLAQINSMKADSTKLKMELGTVAAELKTTAGQLATARAEGERARKEGGERVSEIEERTAALQKDLDGEREKVRKIRMLANKYKNLYTELESKNAQQGAAAGGGGGEQEGSAGDGEKLKRAMEGIRAAKLKIDDLTKKNHEVEFELCEVRGALEALRAESAAARADWEGRLEEMTREKDEVEGEVQRVTEQNRALSATVQEQERTVENLTAQLAAARSRHTEPSGDHRHHHDNQQDTPTASVKPTASASVKPTTFTGLVTPTAAVRPTSIAPDMPPRMVAVTPTTSIHISSPPLLPSTTMVSSSEHSTAGSSGEPSTAHGSSEVRPISRVSSRGASDDQVSSGGPPSGFKRARCDEDEDQQPGPSSKIAMVTSSAHAVVLPECSLQPPPSSGGVVSSSEHADLMVGSSSSAAPADLSSDSTTGAVTSSEALQGGTGPVERGVEMEATTSEATPAAMTPAEEDEEELMGGRGAGAHGDPVTSLAPSGSNDMFDIEVIDVDSESTGEEEEEEEDDEEEEEDEEDDYAEEGESKQLQFSYVQSSDPNMQESSDHESTEGDLLEGFDSIPGDIMGPAGGESTSNAVTSSNIRSLRPGETPWSHLSSGEQNSQPSSSGSGSGGNLRSIRRIKRPPPKKD